MEAMSAESLPIRNQPQRRYTRAEYDDLVNERIELVFGVLVKMSPIDPSHHESTARLDERLQAVVHACIVRLRSPQRMIPSPNRTSM